MRIERNNPIPPRLTRVNLGSSSYEMQYKKRLADAIPMVTERAWNGETIRTVSPVVQAEQVEEGVDQKVENVVLEMGHDDGLERELAEKKIVTGSGLVMGSLTAFYSNSLETLDSGRGEKSSMEIQVVYIVGLGGSIG
ncbi:hypothetical protein RHMOL_Rhmol07G0134800 [Rhododendron molle]|uniref:Uncharacterized protein n=1 Tax=Rhododendron molle TaxID=49168 RepID=A0ACC0N1A8_RHOML|nr:hypothetical protein RHMOL_Rhmol07G0134800 [Rhododendron molle]